MNIRDFGLTRTYIDFVLGMVRTGMEQGVDKGTGGKTVLETGVETDGVMAGGFADGRGGGDSTPPPPSNHIEG